MAVPKKVNVMMRKLGGIKPELLEVLAEFDGKTDGFVIEYPRTDEELMELGRKIFNAFKKVKS